MPKKTLSEKTRSRFSSVISGTSNESPSRRPTSLFVIDPETPSFDKKLDMIFKQNAKISKNISELLSGQRRLEQQLTNLEEVLRNVNETRPDDKEFVNVIIKFFLHYCNNLYTNFFQLEFRWRNCERINQRFNLSVKRGF